MNNTLIVFASEHGTVEKCARELFRLIDGKVDICDLSQRQIIPDLTGYDSIIIGGSIHYGEIQKAISDFCKTNLDLLNKKRIGLFINCIYTGDKAMLQLNNAFPKELNDKAVVRDYFGGEINDLNIISINSVRWSWGFIDHSDAIKPARNGDESEVPFVLTTSPN